MIKKIRYYIFLKDVLLLALTCFGGPQAHFSMFYEKLVKKRAYLTEDELLELNALCNILPGPASTQTITAVGFRIGGPPLAYLTLLVWMLPAVIIMTAAAIGISQLQEKEMSLAFTRFIQPMAVGLIAYAAYNISEKVIQSKLTFIIMTASAALSYFLNSPFVFPILLLAGGLITGLNFKAHPKKEKDKIKIIWTNFFIWVGVFVFLALLGNITQAKPILLFENFYRNGSMIFGGGQALVPLMYTEFVHFKGFLSSEEFLSGYALSQSIPGPVFSFTAYIGALSMREYGFGGEILGAFLSAVGIFLPGTFMIFFVSRFWEQLKKYRAVKASLEGISATSAGMVIAAALLLFVPMDKSLMNVGFTIGTFLVLRFTKIPTPFVILAGLLAGLIFQPRI
jgi:chromate transporter